MAREGRIHVDERQQGLEEYVGHSILGQGPLDPDNRGGADDLSRRNRHEAAQHDARPLCYAHSRRLECSFGVHTRIR